MNSLPWFSILTVVGAALTLVLHELSHAVIVWVGHGKVTTFKPWPHFFEGHFYFGLMTFSDGPAGPPSANIFLLAPLVKACFFFGLWTVLGLLLFVPLLMLAFWELTDIINWIQGYVRRSGNDGGRYRALQ